MSRVLKLLLGHQEPADLAPVLRWWERFTPLDEVFLAFGGAETTFAGLTHPHRQFIADPALRTRDHPLERQSYTAVFRAAADWMDAQDFSHVYFAEYDHLPLAVDLETRLLARLETEGADVLAHHLQRIDATNDPHYLHECGNPRFHPFWEKISVRGDRRVVLSMIAPGSFWTREAFLAVARTPEPFRIYLEIYLPTLAHHLGFRVRDLTDQNEFIRVWGDRGAELTSLARAGAWAVHPVKRLTPESFAQLDEWQHASVALSTGDEGCGSTNPR